MCSIRPASDIWRDDTELETPKAAMTAFRPTPVTRNRNFNLGTATTTCQHTDWVAAEIKPAYVVSDVR